VRVHVPQVVKNALNLLEPGLGRSLDSVNVGNEPDKLKWVLVPPRRIACPESMSKVPDSTGEDIVATTLPQLTELVGVTVIDDDEVLILGRGDNRRMDSRDVGRGVDNKHCSEPFYAR